MDPASAKLIGAGLACSALIGAGVGIGSIFGNFLQGALRNPSRLLANSRTCFSGSRSPRPPACSVSWSP